MSNAVVNLVGYDATTVVKPFGLHNDSVRCYFNSLIQMLASCTSFVNSAVAREQIVHSDFAKQLCQFFHNIIDSDQHIVDLFDRWTEHIDGDFLEQEDVSDTFHHMFDVMDDSGFNGLFQSDMRCDSFCLKCRSQTKLPDDKVFIHSIPHQNANQFSIKSTTCDNEEDHSLNKYIRGNYSYSDSKCVKCNGNYVNVSRATHLPSVLLMSLNKFANKDVYEYPQVLAFSNKTQRTTLHYKLVAIVDHYGSMYGGHYSCRCLRTLADGSIGCVLIDDMGIAPSSFNPTPSAYILAYHFTHKSVDN